MAWCVDSFGHFRRGPLTFSAGVNIVRQSFGLDNRRAPYFEPMIQYAEQIFRGLRASAVFLLEPVKSAEVIQLGLKLKF